MSLLTTNYLNEGISFIKEGKCLPLIRGGKPRNKSCIE